jgi:hypothetical protein
LLSVFDLLSHLNDILPQDLDVSTLVIDVQGKVLCPACHQKIGIGTSGIENFVKTHWGKQKCQKAARAIRDVISQPKINTLFSKPHKIVPSTVHAPLPVKITAFPAVATQSSTPSQQATNETILDRLHAEILAMPASIPEAEEYHDLARFSVEPHVPEGEDAWEVWDPVLNNLLQNKSDDDMNRLVRI